MVRLPYQCVGKVVETSSDWFQTIVIAEGPFLPFWAALQLRKSRQSVTSLHGLPTGLACRALIKVCSTNVLLGSLVIASVQVICLHLTR